MEYSIVVPAYDEEKNIPILYSKLTGIMKKLGKAYEIIFVDDGSRDNTYSEMEKISKKDKNVRVIKFRKNFGQSAAWSAGFDNSKGNYVITTDGDLQNDPEDIPKLIGKIKEGYDVVSGWRFDRKDTFSKRLFSNFSRFLRKKIIDDKIHDSGCSLKIYKRECLENLHMHGEMHRYITELLALQGFKIGEVNVGHHDRKHGKTKYNLKRLPKGMLDLIVVAFWQKYSSRPIHLFGGIGLIMSFIGSVMGAYLVYIKFMYNIAIGNRPLLLLAVLLVILGIQSIIFGLISDILIKMYYSGGRKHYRIEKIL